MNLDFKLKSQVELKATLIASLVGLGLAWAGSGVWALVATSVLTAVLSAVLLAWYRPWFIWPSLNYQQAQPLITYGLTIIAGGFITLLAGKSLTFLGGRTVGAEVLGIFAVASLFSYLPISKTMPIVQQILYPTFAKIAGDNELVRKYVLTSVELTFLVVLPLGIGIAAVAQPLVGAIFGSQWTATALPLAVQGLLTPFRLLRLLSQAPLNATGHAGAVARLATLNLGLTSFAILLAAPHGLIGLCIMSAAVDSTIGLAALVLLKKTLGLPSRDVLAVIWRPSLAALLMAFAAKLTADAITPAMPQLQLVAAVTIGAVVYLLLIATLMGRRLRHFWAILRNRQPQAEANS